MNDDEPLLPQIDDARKQIHQYVGLNLTLLLIIVHIRLQVEVTEPINGLDDQCTTQPLHEKHLFQGSLQPHRTNRGGRNQFLQERSFSRVNVSHLKARFACASATSLGAQVHVANRRDKVKPSHNARRNRDDEAGIAVPTKPIRKQRSLISPLAVIESSSPFHALPNPRHSYL